MSTLVLGLNHHRTPIEILERVALSVESQTALSTAALESPDIAEVVVISTCNRIEVYAEVSAFHGAVADLTAALTSVTGVAADDLVDHLELQYGEAAIAHVFNVAAGLDSMAIGEAQILGQLRDSLSTGQSTGAVGSGLNSLLQQALRTGKQVRTETGLDRVSRSLVEVGLAQAVAELGPLDELTVLVVGAGAMSALSATTAHRLGATVTVVSRTEDRARALADRLAATSRPIEELGEALSEADVVLSCTGATGIVVDLPSVAAAQVARAGRPQVYIDLAMPHDVAAEVGSLRGVTRLGLAELGSALGGGEDLAEVRAARSVVADAVTRHLGDRAAQVVVPTVTAMRAAAAEIVAREIERFDQRTPDLTEAQRAEVHLAVHRVVEKLLHRPTVRVKEMAVDGRITEYEDAIRALFDLHSGGA
ncbi:glutamyl-tRNA reductase [Janibacter sp. YIM B02568]|uniref:glutamyl-tRNA reductase n=1 Tax=Janibacter endophyticus TaxID=2806261 RepID=UPI00194E81FB|nr:glutamyl-tRNA reductase [Janibacter endophyticus]MBM6547133.1 glutamyl-tRNA reductase [Janibacter endophyticus]